jgi:hypothetical protein
MPVEGQWDRNLVPLRPRDRFLIRAFAGVTVLAIAIGLVVGLTRHTKSDPNCVTAIIPAAMGGESQKLCGSDAKTFCATKLGQQVAAAECRRLGYSA